MSYEAIDQLELNIQESKKNLELGEALSRLQKNSDFKLVMLSGFFEKEAVRLVHLKADPAFQTPERQAFIMTQIDAIGTVHQYFHTVAYQAAMAKRSIANDEETRSELLAEGMTNV